MMTAQTYPLFSIGHPLLDIQVTNGEKLLAKYGLNANDAILAGEQHMPMSVSTAR
jgi:adenosine kinase